MDEDDFFTKYRGVDEIFEKYEDVFIQDEKTKNHLAKKLQKDLIRFGVSEEEAAEQADLWAQDKTSQEEYDEFDDDIPELSDYGEDTELYALESECGDLYYMEKASDSYSDNDYY